MFKLLAIATVLGAVSTAPTLTSILNEMEAENTNVVEEKKEESVAKQKRWVCNGCTDNEKQVLEFFQDYGITDKYALATLLGNVKQESMFHPNICEGGARVNYHRCYGGGYGLIQWTTHGRYHGLGHHARITGGDPSTLKTQLSYLVTEREWKAAEHKFKNPGQPIGYYMQGAYRWLGWGIHGNRTHYANQYVGRLTQV